MTMTTADVDLRERAVTRLKKRHDFHVHLLIYLAINGFTTVLWAVTSQGGFFWPVFLMFFWGIGLVGNAWDVYRGDEPSEDRIRREIDRMERPAR
jgi:predicted membrane channel-forming protein YqfA (hemolysin III family)